ncbi:hypothetical protein NBO_42g0009 [Nosema bombycis CQ1]|uniref:Uncharacterized protein n=1 Tax=Nosema bombycis (strain CQ1 / CVCC 102059) TaxID=578461 RepID=R0M7Q3_NOSB1|nr:hypothetical protein NBO_42g0009 [Nosema bombycis CQ1]|eukprot:EOB14019.1 hypothetical protein NBO_42g0009 [Nosema bombycis CQ1]
MINTQLDDLLYDIYILPKWKNQVDFINKIVEDIKDPEDLLIKIKSKWDSIQSDRKDKFYYLIEKLLNKIEINKENLKRILSYSNESTLSYFWKIIIKKISINNMIDINFLIDYLAYCPNHLLKNFEEMKFKPEIIKEILKREDIPNKNREFLSKMIKKM